MVRAVARIALTLMLLASAFGLYASVRALLAEPGLRPLVARSAAEIRAAADREMARAATPERIAARLTALMAETPHNWIAIDAVLQVAQERQIPLPAALEQQIDAARAKDDSWSARAKGCAACAADPVNCSLSPQLMCQLPMVLTPAGDIAGLTVEARNYMADRPVDRINLGLSLAGLGASLLALPSAGSSEGLAIGAHLARLAHGMRLLAPPLATLARRSASAAVDWTALGALRRSGKDLLSPAAWGRVIRPEALRPLREISSDLGRTARAAGPEQALALLPMVEDAADARRLARVSEALGDHSLGRAEILGRGRFLRLGLRVSHLAQGLVASLFGLIYAAGHLLAHGLHRALLRLLLRHSAR
ncbi:hypothetical protein FGG78_31030 [Thioclava sp. BHET1]|nr:hypothetical protein FGG78_31030 [Thioclava sp. BHET1]